MKTVSFLIAILFVFGPANQSVCKIIPEMEECMRSHTTPEEYEAVIKKYADPGIIRQAMGLLVIRNPYVLKAEKKGSAVCYTVEGVTVGTASEIPSDIVQIYKACWRNGRIISLEFFGPKHFLNQDIIPEMQECMRSHTTPEDYQAVIEKYAAPGIIRQAMGLLILKEPYVVKTEKRDAVTIYTVEGITAGTASEIRSDTVQAYKVGWENGKIISIEFQGAKKEPHTKPIP